MHSPSASTSAGEAMTGQPDEQIRVIGGPWPERIGLTGRIVPKLRDEYPWHGCPKNEVVIFIDDDPLTADYGLDWSCVIGRKDIERAP